MTLIRPFCNADLPGLQDVWIKHWMAVGVSPQVSIVMIEQAILSRTFFRADRLLVLEIDGRIEGWSHFLPERIGAAGDDSVALLPAICFTAAGLAASGRLIQATEAAAAAAGFGRIDVGPVRDDRCGYAGLAPIGQGIGIPGKDARVSSLLSRHGYTPLRSTRQLTVATNTYRPPVSREALQFRRTAKTDVAMVYPDDPSQASAMAHLNMELHQLIELRTGTLLAAVGVWTSDPEAQVMDCGRGIIDLTRTLTAIDPSGEASAAAESYLIANVVQSLANRRVFLAEVAIDGSDDVRWNQFQALKFDHVQTGVQWTKPLTAVV